MISERSERERERQMCVCGLRGVRVCGRRGQKQVARSNRRIQEKNNIIGGKWF